MLKEPERDFRRLPVRHEIPELGQCGEVLLADDEVAEVGVLQQKLRIGAQQPLLPAIEEHQPGLRDVDMPEQPRKAGNPMFGVHVRLNGVRGLGCLECGHTAPYVAREGYYPPDSGRKWISRRCRFFYFRERAFFLAMIISMMALPFPASPPPMIS